MKNPFVLLRKGNKTKFQFGGVKFLATLLFIFPFTIVCFSQNTISYTDVGICSQTAPATITGTSVIGILGYSWEESTTSSSSGFTTIPGANAQDYSPGVLGQTTWYMRVASFLFLPLSYSNVVKVTVQTAPSATISYTGSPYCYNSGSVAITFSGTTGGTYSVTPAGASINSATGTVDLAASDPGNYTVTYTVDASGSCAAFTTNTTLIINPNTWTGDVSNDWNTAGNWVAAHDDGCPDLTIPGGVPYQPLVTSGTITIQNLVIKTGGYLTLSNATLQISGTITNDGTMDAAEGTLEMNGTSAQTIPSNTFLNNSLDNLVINNSSASGVTLDGPLDIYGSLTYSGTGRTLNTNDYLTLKSTSAATAYLGDMTGNTITGEATVERYLPARKAWRFLSVPTNSSQTIQQAWQEGCGANADCVSGFGTQITGPGGTSAGFDSYSSLPSMKFYNPITNGWDGVPNTNTQGIASTAGYMVFIRGDRSITSPSAAPVATTLRTKGILYTGDQPAISVQPSEFASVGNPYASALDMRYITKTGLKDFFYVWDPLLSGSYGFGGYQTFSSDGSGNYVVSPGGGSYGTNGSISNYIQSGQAFLVQADSSGGSITLKENAKAAGGGIASMVASKTGPSLRVNLYKVNGGKGIDMADGFLVNYGDGYSNSVNEMDALKLVNTSENLSLKEDNTLLVVQRRHTITRQDTLFINQAHMRVLQYRFEIIAKKMKRPALMGYLEDNFMQTRIPLNLDGTTTIDFKVTNAAGSFAANRFTIVFGQRGSLPVTPPSIQAYRDKEKINIEGQVENEGKVELSEVEKSTNGEFFTTMAPIPGNSGENFLSSFRVTDAHPAIGYNYYRVKCVDIHGNTFYSQIAKVIFPYNFKSDITVFPNPIREGIINLQLKNQEEGLYKIQVLNESGQSILSKQIVHKAGSSMEEVQMGKSFPRGIYQVEITGPQNGTKIIKILY